MLNNRFISTNANNPCPICAKTNGNCRITGELILCMTNTNLYSKDEFRDIGYTYIGDTKNGLWGKFVPDNGYEESWQEKQERIRLAKEKREKADRELKAQYKQSLPVKDRDYYYREISSYLGLNSRHRKDLLNRGLTNPQIDKLNSFSVYDYPTIPEDTPLKLAGVSINPYSGDRTIKKKDKAYFCPAFNLDGLIIGGQWRNENPDNGKYTWLRGLDKNGSKLQNGELPITFVGNKLLERESSITIDELLDKVTAKNAAKKVLETIEGDIKPIFACEGLLKPYIASNRLNIETIGAAGFLFSASPKQVEKIINGGYNLVIFPVDAGAVSNKHILRQLKRNIKLFESLGSKCLVLWYGQESKETAKDIDEIESFERLSNPSLLTMFQYYEMSEKAVFKQDKKDKLEKLTAFDADLTINQQYLIGIGNASNQVLDNIVKNNPLTIIKSAMNTGKSFYLKGLVEKAKKEDRKAFIVGSRRLLTYSLANDCQLPAITEIDEEINQLENLSLDAKINGIYGGLGIVIDSFAKLKNADFANALVIVDECSQLVDHSLNSHTAIKDNRGYILKLFEEKLTQAISTGGNVIGFDANVTNVDADWLKEVCSVEKAFKIENKFKPEKSPINLYSLDSVVNKDDKEKLEDSFFNQLFNDIRQGEIISLSSDNKAELQAVMKRINKDFPDLKTITIDADTARTKDSFERRLITGDFEGNQDEIIKSENFKVLAYSPVMQSGISLDNPTLDANGNLSYNSAHFTKKYAIATKVVSPSIFRQLINRGRSPVPCNLLLRRKANYQNNFDWQEILRNNTLEYAKEKIDLLKQVKENVGVQEIIDLLQNSEQKDNHFDDIHSITKAKLEVRRNLEMSMYEDVLIDELKNDGHEVNIIGLPEIELESIYDSKEAKEEIIRDKAIAIDDAEDIDFELAKKLNKKESLTIEKENQVKKAILKDNFPYIPIGDGNGVDFIFDYVLKDRYKTLNAIKKYWYCQNPELAKLHDTKEFIYALKQAQKSGYLWLWDIKPVTPYTDLFDALKLQELIDYGELISDNCDIVKRFRSLCEDRKNRELLRKLNIKFNKRTAKTLNLLSKVLKLFGFKKGKRQQKKIKGKQIWFYPIEKSVDTTLWDYLIKCYNWHGEKMSKIDWSILADDDGFFDHTLASREFSDKEPTQTHTQQALESVTKSPVIINNKSENLVTDLNPYTSKDTAIFSEKTHQVNILSSDFNILTDNLTDDLNNNSPSGKGAKVTSTTDKDNRLGREYRFIVTKNIVKYNIN